MPANVATGYLSRIVDREQQCAKAPERVNACRMRGQRTARVQPACAGLYPAVVASSVEAKQTTGVTLSYSGSVLR
jgi:hypothetical protein